MGRVFITWIFALMCAAATHTASAKVIPMEIAGGVDCGLYTEEEIGRGDSGCEQFADYFGLDFYPNELGGSAGDNFIIRFRVDMSAPPTDWLSGQWFIGDWVGWIDFQIQERGGEFYFSDGCDGQFAIAVQAFDFPTFLCSAEQSSLTAPTWQQIAQLSAAELSTFGSSGAYDFSLVNGNVWRAGWSVYSIRRISALPEPGTLALLGLGFAGLGLSRRRKAA